VANNACVPTATANGLTYLENYMNFSLDQPSPFTTTPNTYGQVNNLITAMGTTANGTTTANQFNGLLNYLSPGGANPAPTVRVTGQYSAATPAGWGPPAAPTPQFMQTTPTAAYLASVLNANDGVEIGVQWGTIQNGSFSPYNGGHELTLEAINMQAGTITFMDPWGTSPNGKDAGSTANSVQASLQLLNGFLVLTYPQNYVGPDLNTENGAAVGDLNGQVARILDDTVEYVVPEPSTYIAGAMLLIPFAVSSVRKLRAYWRHP